MRVARWLGCIALSGLIAGSAHAAPPQDFNHYISEAAGLLYKDYSRGGYDIGQVFTHPILYGNATISHSPKPKAGEPPRKPPLPSMCVAAMLELIATAVDLYDREGHDPRKRTEQLGIENFTRSSRLTLRGNIFMLAGTGSRGTAWTLERFGLGRQLPFKKLKPGDFINFNRVKSGHAAMFEGFTDKDGADLPAYSAAVAGFRYFSDQGKGKPDAGLAHRWAFFQGNCPALSGGRVHDCNVRRPDANGIILNGGRMLDPHLWTYDPKKVEATVATSVRAPTRAAAVNIARQPLPENVDPRLSGVEDD